MGKRRKRSYLLISEQDSVSLPDKTAAGAVVQLHPLHPSSPPRRILYFFEKRRAAEPERALCAERTGRRTGSSAGPQQILGRWNHTAGFRGNFLGRTLYGLRNVFGRIGLGRSPGDGSGHAQAFAGRFEVDQSVSSSLGRRRF